VLVQMMGKMSSVPEEMWQGKGPVLEPSHGADDGRKGPSPSADVAGLRPLPTNVRQARVQSRCRYSREPSPGAHAYRAGVSAVPAQLRLD
jgi:hypothetical protein